MAVLFIQLKNYSGEFMRRLVEPDSCFSFTVSEQEPETRLDRFLANRFPLYSRSFFQQLIDKGRVTINTTINKKSGAAIRPHDAIIITFPPARVVANNEVETEKIGIEVLLEHPDFLVISKPAGLLVHTPHHLSQEITLVDWLLANYQEIGGIGYVDRPGIVHRLDQNTSGIMVATRTNNAHTQFGNMFRNRTIKKTYHAIVVGHPPRAGTIDFMVGRDPTYRARMTAFKDPNTHPHIKKRDATTHYKVISYFKEHSLVEAKPVTGRTHQIRVHLAALGHPLLGDSLYGTPSRDLPRHALHAHGLSFSFANKDYTLSTPFPADLKQMVSLLEIDEQSS